jgi:PAB-dependent poly(A)-specific ribonuclease subunit 2
MSNTYYVAQPITQLRDSNPLQFPVTALAFDPLSDVLWTGSGAGQVSAYDHNRSRGVYWRHSKHTITKVAAGDSQTRVIDAAGRQLGSYSKGGVTKWQYQYARVSTSKPSRTHVL